MWFSGDGFLLGKGRVLRSLVQLNARSRNVQASMVSLQSALLSRCMPPPPPQKTKILEGSVKFFF
jgi:hypothetical protein